MTREELHKVIEVPGYENYMAHHSGRIFSKKSNRFLKSPCNSDGYPTVGIYLGNYKTKSIAVHRLIARAFHGKRPNDKVVNHINGIKTDNRPENLEYVTQSENHLHAFRLGLRKTPKELIETFVSLSKKRIGGKHQMARKVIDAETGEIFGSVREAARRFGVNESYLILKLNGKKKNNTNLKYHDE